MTTIVHTKSTEIRWPVAAWLPLAVLPIGAGWLTVHAPRWVLMWALALSIYAGFKWLTFATAQAARDSSLGKAAGYLQLWPGMDAEAFFGPPVRARVRWSEWTWAVCQFAVGTWLLIGVAPRFAGDRPLVAGWLAMTGLVSILHFGLAQVLSAAWRTAGVNARHIMHKPLFARSLADFWGRRWNLAFRDLMHRSVLRLLAPRIGLGGAVIAVFFVSGLIHDAVISLAARGGYGLPTLYFLLQGGAVLFAKSRTGRRLGLASGFGGWLFAAIVIVVPAGLLFHPPFLTRVVAPMVEAWGAIG